LVVGLLRRGSKRADAVNAADTRRSPPDFDHRPEIGWRLGYPFSILLLLLAVGLCAIFKRHGWL
jgi:hypothetical protein